MYSIHIRLCNPDCIRLLINFDGWQPNRGSLSKNVNWSLHHFLGCLTRKFAFLSNRKFELTLYNNKITREMFVLEKYIRILFLCMVQNIGFSCLGLHVYSSSHICKDIIFNAFVTFLFIELAFHYFENNAKFCIKFKKIFDDNVCVKWR